MSNEKSSALEVAVSFLIGAAAGFVAGILLAPASGKETGTSAAATARVRTSKSLCNGFGTKNDPSGRRAPRS